MALLLACSKSVVALDARMHAGHWDKSTHKSGELAGKTLGLVGLGAIGLRTARMAAGMEMRIIGFDPYARNLPEYITSVDVETILRESDAISLHCPLNNENRGMLNEQTLARCKHGVIIVNTARGGLIEEEALLKAVRSGQVASAGLDSFATEPMKAGHPFQGEPNIILSPHIGGVTREAYVNMGVAAAQNLLTVLRQAQTQSRA
jgi:D-3-phosphoglycerate dehydrogenase